MYHTLKYLMWILIVPNLAQLRYSQIQVDKTNVNNCKCNNRVIPKRHRGDREAMADRLLQTGKF